MLFVDAAASVVVVYVGGSCSATAYCGYAYSDLVTICHYLIW